MDIIGMVKSTNRIEIEEIIMKMIMETDRLRLRVFEAEDLHAAKGFWGNDDVMVYSGGAVEHALLPVVLDSYARCYEKHGLSIFAVVEKESGKVIGAAGFKLKDTPETVELIYHFIQESWGKGYATEAAIACINVAKNHGQVKKIFASADPHNEQSFKILEKLGFDYQGLKWFEDTEQEEPYYSMNI